MQEKIPCDYYSEKKISENFISAHSSIRYPVPGEYEYLTHSTCKAAQFPSLFLVYECYRTHPHTHTHSQFTRRTNKYDILLIWIWLYASICDNCYISDELPLGFARYRKLNEITKNVHAETFRNAEFI